MTGLTDDSSRRCIQAIVDWSTTVRRWSEATRLRSQQLRAEAAEARERAARARAQLQPARGAVCTERHAEFVTAGERCSCGAQA